MLQHGPLRPVHKWKLPPGSWFVQGGKESGVTNSGKEITYPIVFNEYPVVAFSVGAVSASYGWWQNQFLTSFKAYTSLSSGAWVYYVAIGK